MRQQSYDNIVGQNPTQKIFYNGWNNRVNSLRKAIEEGRFIDPQNIASSDPYMDSIVDTIMKRYLPNEKDFTREEIAKMSSEEFARNEKQIIEQMLNGRIRNQKPDYSKFINPLSGRKKVYTKEEVSKMSQEEYTANEKEIMAQANSIGLPEHNEVYKRSSNAAASNGKKWVTINGNHVLID